MADWQKIGGIAAVVAIPVSILIAVAQCGNGSNNSTPPTTPSTTAGPGGSGQAVPPDTSVPTPPEQPWPAEPAGASHQTGTIAIKAYTSLGGDSFDLDKNKMENGVAESADLVAQESGLGANAGTQVALWSGPEQPTLQDCRRLPGVAYAQTELIDAASFETAARYCVRSSEGRFGRVRTISAESGNIPQFNFSYVLWKKPGDK